MILSKNGMETEYKSFALRTIGSTHIVHNRLCEDYALKNETDKYSIIAVCDGHGGDDYVRSSKGSKFVAEVTESCVAELIAKVDDAMFTTEKSRETLFRQLETSIIARWNEKTMLDWVNNPLTEEEKTIISEKALKKYEEGNIQPAYGTTLATVVMTPKYWFALQIGDCRCVVIDNEGKCSQPVPWDEKCVGAETTSICDSRSIEEFRHYYSTEFPKAVFIASDGIEDSFRGEEKMYDFYKTVFDAFTDKEKSWNDAENELADYLPRMSEQGSHDDISVAGLLRISPKKGEDITVEKTSDTNSDDKAEENNSETADRNSKPNNEANDETKNKANTESVKG